MEGIGHNNMDLDARKRLQGIIDRVEDLDKRRADIGTDIRDIYAEAKSAGFEPNIIKHIVRQRKMDEAKRREQEELIDLYRAAIGME